MPGAEGVFMEKRKSGFRAADLAYTAVCAALIAVCSWISIPGPVPFTLQTFGVFSALGILGGKRGTAAILIYLLLGAAGLPVFAGFNGGAGALLGSTGGYLTGFLFLGLICWLGEVLFGTRPAVRIASMLLGLAVCYAFGTLWFMRVYARGAGEIALKTALGWCVFPFVVPDLAKLGLSLPVSARVHRQIR